MPDHGIDICYHRRRFVTSFKDRHGKIRYRFRRKGLKTRYFSAPEGSAHFKSEYYAFYRGEDHPKIESIAKRVWTPVRKHPERVYFIGTADRAAVKIGMSRHPRARMSELQISCHQALSLLAMIRGGRDLELEYHKRFEHLRLRGEWFSRTPEIDAAIQQIRNGSTSNTRLRVDTKGQKIV